MEVEYISHGYCVEGRKEIGTERSRAKHHSQPCESKNKGLVLNTFDGIDAP